MIKEQGFDWGRSHMRRGGSYAGRGLATACAGACRRHLCDFVTSSVRGATCRDRKTFAPPNATGGGW